MIVLQGQTRRPSAITSVVVPFLSMMMMMTTLLLSLSFPRACDAFAPPGLVRHRSVAHLVSSRDVVTITTASTRLWDTEKNNGSGGPTGEGHNNMAEEDDSNSDDDNNNKNDEEKQDQIRLQQERADMKKRIWKNVLIADKQMEIDEILNSPDPPFDLRGELDKVTYMSTGLDPDSDEAKIDEKVVQLEVDMYKAAAKSDFTKAENKSLELAQMHIDDCGNVLRANWLFYKAFSDKDYDLMESLWLQDNSVVCIHPSHEPLVGFTKVVNSWQELFDSTVGDFQANWMEPSNVRLTVKGTLAIITCDEEVFTRRFIRGEKRKSQLVNKMTATNIYRKVGGTWKMVHHHASWHAESEAAKKALGGGSSSDSNRNRRDGSGSRKKLVSGGSISDLTAGILGTRDFGADLKDDNAGQSGKNKKPRIVMGSLQDLLGGGLGDIISRSVESTNDEDDDEEESTSISFHASMGVNDDDDEDDEDDDDDDDDDDDNDDENHILDATSLSRSRNRIQSWTIESDNNNNNVLTMTHSPSSKADNNSNLNSNNSSNNAHEASRQQCIAALRKLSEKVRERCIYMYIKEGGERHGITTNAGWSRRSFANRRVNEYPVVGALVPSRIFNQPLVVFSRTLCVCVYLTLSLCFFHSFYSIHKHRDPSHQSRSECCLPTSSRAPQRESSAWSRLLTKFCARKRMTWKLPRKSLLISAVSLPCHYPRHHHAAYWTSPPTRGRPTSLLHSILDNNEQQNPQCQQH